MFVTLITDCKDDNALGRSTTRLATFFECHITTVGVNSDLEASGNLIDVLDAAGGEKGVVLVNVAPRHQEAKKWPNGTPFGFFYYKETLVVASIDGLTLSLVKKLGLVDKINLMDIPEVVTTLADKKIISQELATHIIHTQFRSFEFLPRVAKWLTSKVPIPYNLYPITLIPDAPESIWWIDNFGNCKTTLVEKDVNFSEGQKKTNKAGEFICYNRLKDVPNDRPALIIGSSGLEDNRFLEIVVQGGSASQTFNLKSGSVF